MLLAIEHSQACVTRKCMFINAIAYINCTITQIQIRFWIEIDL
jgi:hypothetical protein